MKRNLLTLLIIFTIIFEAIGAQTDGKNLCCLLSDVSKISLTLYGDEFVHYYLTIDSIPVFENEGGYYYGEIIDGDLAISDVLAHEIGQRTVNEKKFVDRGGEILSYLKDVHREKFSIENERRIQPTLKTRGVGDFQSHIGSKRGLVILVNFQNLTMSSENPNLQFNRMFNEIGYSDNGSVGSVHDYFYDQSYGKFDLSFDVIGPVLMKENFGYYGTNQNLTGYDKRAHEMVIEACLAIDDEVDFTIYDWDGDGTVDQVFIIYAGYGEHAGAPANTIWPHESELGEGGIELDGVKINTYACSCELSGISGTVPSGIGTPCHEFSHCLGLPDLYDTDYSGAFGMGIWDLMNSGSHSGPTGNGEVPYGYSAYERWMCGWLEPIRIDETINIEEMKNLEDVPEAYILYNEGNENEYFILENHQPAKWFRYAGKTEGAHGLMVTHVDYDPRAWQLNIVNPKPDHQRMTIIAADKSYGLSEDEYLGDLFPGKDNMTWFTSESHNVTGGKLYNKNVDGTYNLSCAVSKINEEDGKISFEVWFDYNLESPIVSVPTDIDETGFTANWEPLNEAESYELEIRTRAKIQGFPLERVKSIEGIIGTEKRTEWLLDGGDTHYRVRGKLHGIPSSWSYYMAVVNDSGVESIFSEEDNVEYFTIDGLRNTGLSKGLNIVKKKGVYKKIYVK